MRKTDVGIWSRESSGFTLVELLAAIGIIAVLATLTIVSVKKFKESSLRTVCAGNLRQIGAAATLYAAENNGFYPYTYDRILGIHNPITPGLIDCLGEYVKNDFRIFYCTDVRHCMPPPTTDDGLSYQGQLALPESDRFLRIGYYWLPSTDNHWQALPQKTAGSLNRVFATCLSFGGGTVHNRLQNMLYADGHVIQKQAGPGGAVMVFVSPETLLIYPAYEDH